MKQGQDITADFPGLFLIHQKIKGSEVADHLHDDGHEIFFPLQGEIQVRIGDKTLKAGPGKMLFIPAGVEHSFSSSKIAQGERLIAIISASRTKAIEGFDTDASVRSVSQLSKELLFHLLLNQKSKTVSSLIQTFLETIGEMLATATLDDESDLDHLSGRTSDPRVRKALKLLSERELKSMTEIAEEADLSIRTMNRLFMTELGVTPKQVIILRRVNEAKILLKAGRTVTDTAFEVGYDSVSQFISTFRKVTGQLPSEFR